MSKTSRRPSDVGPHEGRSSGNQPKVRRRGERIIKPVGPFGFTSEADRKRCPLFGSKQQPTAKKVTTPTTIVG